MHPWHPHTALLFSLPPTPPIHPPIAPPPITALPPARRNGWRAPASTAESASPALAAPRIRVCVCVESSQPVGTRVQGGGGVVAKGKDGGGVDGARGSAPPCAPARPRTVRGVGGTARAPLLRAHGPAAWPACRAEPPRDRALPPLTPPSTLLVPLSTAQHATGTVQYRPARDWYRSVLDVVPQPVLGGLVHGQGVELRGHGQLGLGPQLL